MCLWEHCREQMLNRSTCGSNYHCLLNWKLFMLNCNTARKHTPGTEPLLHFTSCTAYRTTQTPPQQSRSVQNHTLLTNERLLKSLNLWKNGFLFSTFYWGVCERISKATYRISGWKRFYQPPTKRQEQSLTLLNTDKVTVLNKSWSETRAAKCTFIFYLWNKTVFSMYVGNYTYHFVFFLVVGGQQAPFDIQRSRIFRGQSELAVQLHTLTAGLLYGCRPCRCNL